MLYTLDIPNFWQIYTEKPFHMKGFKPKHHKAILRNKNLIKSREKDSYHDWIPYTYDYD